MQTAEELDMPGTDGVEITGPSGGHIIADTADQSQFATNDGPLRNKPRGNSVSHEDEMMNVASNQMDYEAVTQLYTHSLGLIKLAAGKE